MAVADSDGRLRTVNPVVADDGHTYEQEHIERWLAINSIAEPPHFFPFLSAHPWR